MSAEQTHWREIAADLRLSIAKKLEAADTLKPSELETLGDALLTAISAELHAKTFDITVRERRATLRRAAEAKPWDSD